jgi:hypothetical protein
MTEGRPLPATCALIDWFELSTKQRSFIEAAAAINLAAEGQVPGAFGPMARRLQATYGLGREAVEFWDIHEMADAEQSVRCPGCTFERLAAFRCKGRGSSPLAAGHLAFGGDNDGESRSARSPSCAHLAL